jgi:hypothetical protein
MGPATAGADVAKPDPAEHYLRNPRPWAVSKKELQSSAEFIKRRR